MEGNIKDFGKNASNIKNNHKKVRIESREISGSEKEHDFTGKAKLCQWNEVKYNVFTTCGSTRKKLESGVYAIMKGNGMYYFSKQNIHIDELIDFKDSESHKVLEEISKFWTLEKEFKHYGFLHRRGYLFYGIQGCGKSSLVQLIIKDIINNQDGIVILCNNSNILAGALFEYRQVEPERKIVCVFEDIDAIIDTHGESKLCSFLDGEIQINKILNIATTNYPERLDKRIVKRPRRFDRLIFIDMPNAGIRKEYFSKKLKIEDSELDKWVSATKSFSFAAMADLVISVKCLKNDFDDSINKLKKLLEQKISSTNFNNEKVGFR